MNQELEKAISSGDYVWTEFGEYTLRELPDRLAEIGVLDASSCRYIHITEQGKHNHDKNYVRLLCEISAAGDDVNPIKSSPGSFFFPEIYLKPEWARRQREYYLAQAAKCDPFCELQVLAPPIPARGPSSSDQQE